MNKYSHVSLYFKDSNYNLIAINGKNLGEVRFHEDPTLLDSDGAWEKIKACVNGHIVNGYLDVSKLKPITDSSLKDRSLALTDESEIIKNSRSINEICIQALSIKEEDKSLLRSLIRLNIDYNEYQEALFESENNDEDFGSLSNIFNKTFPNNSYQKIKSLFTDDSETLDFLDKFFTIELLSNLTKRKYHVSRRAEIINDLFSKTKTMSTQHLNSFIEYALKRTLDSYNFHKHNPEGILLLNNFPLLKIRDLLVDTTHIKYKSIIDAAKIALLIDNQELFNFFAKKAAKTTGFGIISKDLMDLATATTNPEIFESLLSKIPDLDLIDCIEAAAQSNFHMVTDFLLSKTEIISGEDLNRIVESISDPTDKSVFDFFYNAKDSATYSSIIDKSLVSKSILLNLKRFLSNGADISDIHLIQAFKLAVKFGNQSLVEFYLSKISTIDLSGFPETGLPNHQMLKDFILAISNKDVENKIIEFILEHIATFLSKGAFMLSEDIGKALELAVKIRNEPMVRVLLSENRHIPEANLGKAVIIEIKSRIISIKSSSIGSRYEGYKIPVDYIGEPILEILLSEGRRISETDLGKAVKTAAKYGYLDGLKILLSGGRRISETDLYNAAYLTIISDFTLPTKFLLSGDRNIKESKLLKLIDCAFFNNSEYIIDFFSSKPNFIELLIKFTETIEDITLLAEETVNYIYNFIIEKLEVFLLGGGTISDKCLTKIVELAAYKLDIIRIQFFLSEDRKLTLESKNKIMRKRLTMAIRELISLQETKD